MKAIIFQNDEGGVSILDPISNYPHLNHIGVTVEQVAAKDVPSGKPYKILDKSEISTDRTFRNAWEVDASLLVDGVGLSEEDKAELMAELYVKSAIIQILSQDNLDPALKAAIVEINRQFDTKEITAIAARQMIVDAHSPDTLEA